MSDEARILSLENKVCQAEARLGMLEGFRMNGNSQQLNQLFTQMADLFAVEPGVTTTCCSNPIPTTLHIVDSTYGTTTLTYQTSGIFTGKWTGGVQVTTTATAHCSSVSTLLRYLLWCDPTNGWELSVEYYGSGLYSCPIATTNNSLQNLGEAFYVGGVHGTVSVSCGPPLNINISFNYGSIVPVLYSGTVTYAISP